MVMMMNHTKTNTTFLSYFVQFFWGFWLMEVGLGQSQTSEIKVGVVVDLNTTFSKICLTSINMSLSRFYEDHPSYRTRLTLHIRDSMEDTVQASAAALDLIKNEQVSAIIGPRNSIQAEFMIRLANKTQVPTITFSAISPLLTSIKSPYFVRATLDDSSQVVAIAAIIKSFRWRRVVAIYVDNELGEGFMPFLSDALQDVEVNRSVVSPEANDDQILKELHKLMRRQTRVFVVHMESSLAFRVFQKAREIGMMEEGYVWLMTNGITHMMRHINNGHSLNTIEGVVGVRSHVPKSKELENFRLTWKRTFKKKNPLMRNDVDPNVFALWAYDSITALAMAVENTNLKSLGYDNGSASSNNIDLGTVGVSRYGPSLLKALSKVRFKGLAGDFNLIDGQLESSKFEIINFIGNEARIIGFWTLGDGLVNANSNKTMLGPVIWPGKSKIDPKGWEIPGKKIKVGVPLKRGKGFFGFVEVNNTTLTGYTIEIFEAALKKLPYLVNPEYVTCDSSVVDYNEMVYQVHNRTWDAVAGDLTITAHRSLYVDFTLPFTESGVSMMVPLRDNENKNAWVFLKPWSLDLWVTTGCFFVLIGFIVWLFEHRVNTDFRGPPNHQIGTSFWFSFSTMVFAHGEKVVSNLSRFVVVVWCFVVLVLTQSYTASLTSFLTVQRFQPTATNVGLGQSQTSEIKVGVVLDLNTTFSKICLTSINLSLSDFYEDHPSYRTRLTLHIRDSMEDTVQASAAAVDLIKNEQVSAIIGPINSMQAEFMIRLANKTQVPTITFSATSPLLTSVKSPYFVRAALDDSSQVRAIAAIFKSFRWRSVVVIYVDNELGEGFMPFLSDALQDVEVNRSVVSPEADDDQILKELHKLMSMQTRVFVVHMDSSLALRVFKKAREIGMMEEGYVWLMTSGITHMMRHIGRSLNTIEGVLGVKSHVPKSKELEDFRLRWKRTFKKENPLMRNDVDPNVFALWAYDSITALARAVKKADIETLWYDNGSASSKNIDFGTLAVSRYGPSLLEALSEVRFKGLAGEFKLVNRQLESSKYEIINFIGKEERIIGYWTPNNGLVNAKSNKTTSFAGEKFGPVIWPGKSTVVPRGWEINPGKKIKVCVPLKRGFYGFVVVNKTTVTGYAIDIFEAALKELPYLVIPEYFRFDSSVIDYNEMVYQVHNRTWDAVVGDIAITANRSLYADFTLPYTESGVSMMVPVRDNENTWVFLRPWSLNLWVTTGCFFVLIGFVVWLFEHRVNTDFRGPPHHQIGTSVWFSFSTMVFAHREKVVSNLARFVVVVWCFVMLVLTQSYTASLASFLTVQRFHPTATNVHDLIKNRNCVGYQEGSFVEDILLGLGFQDTELKAFGCAEECDELFSNGTIAAAFDEVTYLKVILSKYCSKYAMVEPTFKTGGFGFAFPKNSPLTADVSRAILNVTQSKQMKKIENIWFPEKNGCHDPNTALSSNRLSLSSFWGLFLIAGIASFLALIVFVALFLYEQRHILCDDSEDSLWRKLKFLFRIFDEKDQKSHTFKNNAVHNVSSPITLCIPSPSTVQIRPRPQSPLQNREFELRRVSFTPSDERFTTQPIHYEDGESEIECGVEQ